MIFFFIYMYNSQQSFGTVIVWLWIGYLDKENEAVPVSPLRNIYWHTPRSVDVSETAD